jgi:hypothetical protein
MRDSVKDEIAEMINWRIDHMKAELLMEISGNNINDATVRWKVQERLEKLEDLTKANDYEYITETKLVKKNKKGLNENTK